MNYFSGSSVTGYSFDADAFQEFGFTSDSLISSLTFVFCIGRGSFGMVFKSIDLSETETAIKIIFSLPFPNGERIILRECSLLRGFHHGNLVNILDVACSQLSEEEITELFKNTLDERDIINFQIQRAKRYNTIPVVFIQTELCGENLRTRLNSEKKVDLQTTRSVIIKNVVSGLKYLHDNRIIHRDLKPDNIMFSKAGFTLPVKIGDFGLSRQFSTVTDPQSYLTKGVGTFMYRAPEVSNNYDHRADIYSFGLISWEVAQFLPVTERQFLFQRLTHDNEELKNTLL